MKLSVIKLDGKAAGDVELSDVVFGISDIRGDLNVQGCHPVHAEMTSHLLILERFAGILPVAG